MQTSKKRVLIHARPLDESNRKLRLKAMMKRSIFKAPVPSVSKELRVYERRWVEMTAILWLQVPLLASAADTPPFATLRLLSEETATRIVSAAVTACAKRGYNVSAAVVGRDGNLLAFVRSPLSGPHTIEASQRKAFTSATLQAATSEMKSRPDLSFAPGILLIPGGVPISAGGYLYGAAAVAGAPPEDDEKCAKAGIEAAAHDPFV
jgi:uncharacterized protein GlcG (DUF336 family)